MQILPFITAAVSQPSVHNCRQCFSTRAKPERPTVSRLLLGASQVEAASGFHLRLHRGGSPVSFNSTVPLYGRNAHLANFLFACVPPSSRWLDVKRKSRHLKMTSSLPINHLPPLSRLHCLFFFFNVYSSHHSPKNDMEGVTFFADHEYVCVCVRVRWLVLWTWRTEASSFVFTNFHIHVKLQGEGFAKGHNQREACLTSVIFSHYTRTRGCPLSHESNSL